VPPGYDVPWPVVADWWLRTYGSPPYDEALARRTYAQALAVWRQYTAAQSQSVSAPWTPAAPTPANVTPTAAYAVGASHGYPPAASGGYGYPAASAWSDAANWDVPPRPQRHGLLAAILMVLLVAVPLATAAIGLVYWTSSGGFAGVGDARVNDGPTPMAGVRFEPTSDQYYYFLEVGTAVEDGRVVRWNADSVDVTIDGAATDEDRRVVDEALADINRTIGEPEFDYSAVDPEIVIRFLDHDEFVKLPIDQPDAIGWCSSSYSATDYTLSSATISIDDSPEFRGARASVIYHELGHAIGLDDVERAQWRQTIMYYEVSDPTSYTTADLAAISMLYDPRLDAGDTTRDIKSIWSPH
jgi:hypothetical protein